MAKNIEIKARIESIDALLPLAVKIADDGLIETLQDAMFFPAPTAG